MEVSRYTARQNADVQRYGKKEFRSTAPQEIVEELTPHRRQSNKPCTLTDPKYFIEQFEQAKGEKYLPAKWSSMTTEEKVDYIVKDRYSSLVAYKSMNKLHELAKDDDFDAETERLISLNKDGDVMEYTVSSEQSQVVSVPNEEIKTTIHNHPARWEQEEIDVISDKKPKNFHSVNDLKTSIKHNITSYVVDEFGNKFKLEPVQNIDMPNKPDYTDEKKRTIAAMQIGLLSPNPDDVIRKYRTQMDNANTIEEWSAAKYQCYNEMMNDVMETIQEAESKDLCHFTDLSESPKVEQATPLTAPSKKSLFQNILGSIRNIFIK